MKILITGGAGFIGYHLASHLLAAYGEGARLTLIDNLQRGKMDDDFENLLRDKRINFLNLDLTDSASYAKLGSGYDHVYHLAAVNGTKLFYSMPHEVLRVNTLSLIYMLEWFGRENPKGKFCFTSSNEAYAGALSAFNQLPIPTPEEVPLVINDPYNPRWSYAATKLIGELFVIHYAKMHNFRALIVRPHNFYGPRAGYDHVIPEFSIKIAKREDPFTILGAEETRTFCYIDDAVRAMQMLMDSSKTDLQPVLTVHIGDAEEIAMRELAEKFFDLSGWKPKTIDIKDSLPGSVARRRADISKLQALVGWRPEVMLEEGLRRTYEWYAAHPKK
ncbi:GDP-mannose 4,6-dehydratase [Candidatus Uhrbacteria bacterium]|nr:GDP-mannose 4,6-dehydratase [Candidatus Uhrbacteria bacterium]